MIKGVSRCCDKSSGGGDLCQVGCVLQLSYIGALTHGRGDAMHAFLGELNPGLLSRFFARRRRVFSLLFPETSSALGEFCEKPV